MLDQIKCLLYSAFKSQLTELGLLALFKSQLTQPSGLGALRKNQEEVVTFFLPPPN